MKNLRKVIILLLSVVAITSFALACAPSEGEKDSSDHTHSYSATYKYDYEYHWKECECGEEKGKEKHTGGEATCTEKAVCSDCGTEYGELLNHKYVLEDGIRCECGAYQPTYYTEGLSFELNREEYAVVGYSGTSVRAVIPSVYNDKPVTSIKEGAFYENRILSSVVIGDNVKSIGNYAFQDCTYIASVEMPNSVKSIGVFAFYRCSSLKSIVIPEGVTSIGSHTFAGCDSLTSVEIPNSITDISRYSFGYEFLIDDFCENLSVNFYEGGKYLGNSENKYLVLIAGDSDVTSCKVHEDTKIIAGSAFAYCTSLTSVVIGDSVTSIGSYVFGGCSSLTSVEIPDSVTSIGEEAFYWCNNLKFNEENGLCYLGNEENPYLYLDHAKSNEITALELNSNCALINLGFFYDCSSLTSVEIPEENESFQLIDDVLYSKDGKNLIRYFPWKAETSFTIPSTVEEISEYSFCRSDLISVKIPSSVTTVGSGAFTNCISLMLYCEAESKPLGWSNTLTGLDYYKYYLNNPIIWDCNNNDVADDGYIYTIIDQVRYGIKDGEATLSRCYHNANSVDILKTINYNGTDYSVKNIEYCAFYDCQNLTDVVIPDSVTSISASAFASCYNLKSIKIPNSVTSIEGSLFDNYYSGNDVTFYCEAQSKPVGWNDRWNADGSISERYRVVWDCNSNDVADDGYVYTVIDGIKYMLKDGAATVARQATDFVEVIIPKSVSYKGTSYDVTSICDRAFLWCNGLTSVVIPESVTSIGDYALSFCDSLTNIEVSNNNAYYKSIGGNLYSKDGKTLIKYATKNTETSFIIPDGVESICNYAFYYCDSLTSIEIPNSVTSIGNYAFSDCTSLTSIVIPDSVISIGDYAFADCYSLTSVVIGDSVTSIGDYAFRDCTSLTSVVIGDSVTSIGDYAFRDCTSLTSVEIPNSVTSIGDHAFSDCTSLTTVTFRVTEGWHTKDFDTFGHLTVDISFSSEELSNTETAAKYLKDYSDSLWERS